VPKRGPGQPPYEPTPADRATVQNLAALGATHKEIAMCIGRYGVSEPTLRKHFRRELNNSLTEVKALAMSQVVAAMKRGEPWAVCFFLKCRGGWRERQDIKQQVEHSGPGGEVLKIELSRVEAKKGSKPPDPGSLGDADAGDSGVRGDAPPRGWSSGT
jgi:hypothetical protein